MGCEAERIGAKGQAISVATIYPGPNVAAWVGGPSPIPQPLLDLGFTFSPDAQTAEPFGIRSGRAFISPERLDLFAAQTMLLLQTPAVEGEMEAVEKMKASALWARLPAVQAGARLRVRSHRLSRLSRHAAVADRYCEGGAIVSVCAAPVAHPCFHMQPRRILRLTDGKSAHCLHPLRSPAQAIAFAVVSLPLRVVQGRRVIGNDRSWVILVNKRNLVCRSVSSSA